MKNLTMVVGLCLSLCISMTTPAFAREPEIITIGKEGYVKQVMSDWCWAATAHNFMVALKPNMAPFETDEEIVDELLPMIKRHFRIYGYDTGDHQGYSPRDFRYEAAPYNRGMGLRDTIDLCKDNYGRNYDYGYIDGAGQFRMLWVDLKVGIPEAFRLDKKSRSSHIVLACGADKKAKDAFLYDSGGNGRYQWVNYNEFANGKCEKYSGYKIGAVEFADPK